MSGFYRRRWAEMSARVRDEDLGGPEGGRTPFDSTAK